MVVNHLLFADDDAVLLRLHVKRRSAKMRQPVLMSLYHSVYMSESHSHVADVSVNSYYCED